MKIAILLPDLRGGGVERIRIVLAHEFVRAGHEVEFVLMQARGELLAEVRASFSVIDLGARRIRAVPVALIRYLRLRRPGVLLAAMWPLTGIAGMAAKISGQAVCVVASEHVDFRRTPSIKNSERWLLKRFGRALYGPCQSIIGVSDGVVESLSEVVGLPRKRLSVIHNPVRAMRPRAMDEEDKISLAGWLAAKKKIIAIGTLKRQKGFNVLLKAFSELDQKLDAQLLILGDGELRGELENQAKNLGVADRFSLPGFRADTGTFLQYADCFVLSSDWEGFGNVLVEALGSGVSVVSTDCPSGPDEILSSGKFGRLVTPGDWKAMAEAIRETLKLPSDPGFLKSRAADFNPAKQAARYLDLMTNK